MEQALNPFTSIMADFASALFTELSAIRKDQAKIMALYGASDYKTDEDDTVETVEAAKILHLSKSRFTAIHKKFFNSIKPPGRKKMLFQRQELLAYLNGTLAPKVDQDIKAAEDHRINKLSNKLRVAGR